MVNRNQKKKFQGTFLQILAKSVGIAICVFFIAILVWEYGQNKIVSVDYLDQQGQRHTLDLTVKDRERLEGLMQKLFAENSFAYTILGSKPISWETYQNPFPLSNWTQFWDSFSERNRTIRSGWETWEKYQHLFPTALIWSECPTCHPGLTSLLIINEEAFSDVVKKNMRDFQEVLSRDIVDGHQLIGEAINCSLINDVLKGHQALIGIVLGYGRNNAWKFHEAGMNRMKISWVWESEESYFDEDSIDSDAPLTDYYISHYSCPSFAGEPNSAESLELKREYVLTRQKIIKYYKGKDFLGATLSLLAGYHPKHDCGGDRLEFENLTQNPDCYLLMSQIRVLFLYKLAKIRGQY